jgi:hypothetical protein
MKKFNDFNNNLTKEFYKLNIGRSIRLIGSSNKKNILYNSDYDLESHFGTSDKNKVLNKIYDHFKNIFIDAKKDPNIFLTDFKCGEKNGEPIRWEYKDIIKGYKDGYHFIDCLLQKSTIKLDEIYLLNGSFIEISDNYYFTIGDHQNFPPMTRKEIIQSIKNDYNELVKEGNYYKALKREYSIKPTKKLTDYFNSEIGILNKARSDLDVLLLLNEQTFRKPNINDINNNLQIIKQDLSYTNTNFSDDIDEATKTKNKSLKFEMIQKIRDDLFRIINKDAKKLF